MNIDQMLIAKVELGIRNQHLKGRKINNKALSDLLGKDRSWASKFFSGKLKRLAPEDLLILERELEIRLAEPVTGPSLSPLAAETAIAIDSDPDIRAFWESFKRAQNSRALPWVDTSDLEKVGSMAIQLSHESPDKPAKVGASLISWLGKFYEKKTLKRG